MVKVFLDIKRAGPFHTVLYLVFAKQSRLSLSPGRSLVALLDFRAELNWVSPLLPHSFLFTEVGME